MSKKIVRRYPRRTRAERELAGEMIAEEVRTGRYPQKQAVAIGLSRARRETKQQKIDEIVRKYL